jgi:PHP family Zn ribbon phosphoesterase
MKFVVPIIIEGEFLGTAGGCGLLREGEQVDAYLVHRTTGLVENQVQQLASDIDIIPSEKVNEILDFVKTRVSEAIEQFNSGHIAAAAG